MGVANLISYHFILMMMMILSFSKNSVTILFFYVLMFLYLHHMWVWHPYLKWWLPFTILCPTPYTSHLCHKCPQTYAVLCIVVRWCFDRNIGDFMQKTLPNLLHWHQNINQRKINSLIFCKLLLRGWHSYTSYVMSPVCNKEGRGSLLFHVLGAMRL